MIREERRRGFSAALAGIAILTALDQVTKYLAVRYLRGGGDLTLIPGVFQLTYLENRGAAWGMFYGMRWLFLLLTAGILAFLWYVCRRAPGERRYLPLRVLCVFFSAGALGNAIDRLARGYVVDFFYFSLIHFPVFNVADCFVCVSLVLALIIYRNEDFSWMKRRS